MKLFSNIKVFIVVLLYFINLVFLFIPLSILGLVCYLVPVKFWRRYFKCCMERLYIYWVKGNYFIQKLTTSIEWEITGLDQLVYDEWYLLIANHQSWADILVLQRIFNGKIPPLKFFLKKELLYTLPFASWSCWLLGFPFMHRYSKKVLAKHPELKNKDVEATKRACNRFKEMPTTVANFIEGTRFTKKKHQLQASPYHYLLRPKSTGIGFSLAVLGDFFDKILNVTIIYPPQRAGLWHFLTGDIKKITLHIEVIPITSDWLGDYQNDRQFRINLQNKLNQLWEKKDKFIKEVKAKAIVRQMQ
ncbi:MAG: acyltransferase [Rickettsiella sp.]|nr:acyltransferase [Rickettsiella sp.]